MKIGTDAVLLGAWAPIRGARRILDIGTGCGIIALMLAQRSAGLNSQIAAIEIEPHAARESLANFKNSPWKDRLPQDIEAIHQSLQQFGTKSRNQRNQKSNFANFDLAVCNPPYFKPTTQSPSEPRCLARETDSLSTETIYRTAKTFLAPQGRLCLVLPQDQAGSTIELARSQGFHLWSRTDVRPNPTSKLKRVLLEFGLTVATRHTEHHQLVVEIARHQYSEDYAQLTQAFHLRYANNRADIR